jgi:hypothetical protein
MEQGPRQRLKIKDQRKEYLQWIAEKKAARLYAASGNLSDDIHPWISKAECSSTLFGFLKIAQGKHKIIMYKFNL